MSLAKLLANADNLTADQAHALVLQTKQAGVADGFNSLMGGVKNVWDGMGDENKRHIMLGGAGAAAGAVGGIANAATSKKKKHMLTSALQGALIGGGTLGLGSIAAGQFNQLKPLSGPKSRLTTPATDLPGQRAVDIISGVAGPESPTALFGLLPGPQTATNVASNPGIYGGAAAAGAGAAGLVARRNMAKDMQNLRVSIKDRPGNSRPGDAKDLRTAIKAESPMGLTKLTGVGMTGGVPIVPSLKLMGARVLGGPKLPERESAILREMARHKQTYSTINLARGVSQKMERPGRLPTKRIGAGVAGITALLPLLSRLATGGSDKAPESEPTPAAE